MWSDLDAIGEKLGYPIYLFQGGYCAKSMVCENQTAIAVVRKLPRSGKLQVFMASEDFPLAQFDVLAVPFSSDDREDEWDLEKATLQVVNGRKIEDFRLAKVFLLQGQGRILPNMLKPILILQPTKWPVFCVIHRFGIKWSRIGFFGMLNISRLYFWKENRIWFIMRPKSFLFLNWIWWSGLSKRS